MPTETQNGIPDLTGKIIGSSITLGRHLGHGAFGTVYRGFDTVSGEAYAVKAINRPTNRYMAMKLEREQRVHSFVSSDPSVVTLRAVYEDESNMYFVMDLCSGGNLSSSRLLTKENPLDPAVFRKKRDMLVQLLEVVHRCHSKLVFHRDIKPENILLDEAEERIYLADFGLVSETTTSNETREGTSEYMSPECYAEFSPHIPFLNGPTDVWALGVLLHRVMFNKLPWTRACIDSSEFRDFLCDKAGYFLRRRDISKEAHELLTSVFEIVPEKRITIPQFCSKLGSIQQFFVSGSDATTFRFAFLPDVRLAWSMSQRARAIENYIRFQRRRDYIPLTFHPLVPTRSGSSSTLRTVRLVKPLHLATNPALDPMSPPPLSPYRPGGSSSSSSSSSSSPSSVVLTPRPRNRGKPLDAGVVHNSNNNVDLVKCMNALDLQFGDSDPESRPSAIHVKDANAIKELAQAIIGKAKIEKIEGDTRKSGKKHRLLGFARTLKVHHRVVRE